VRPVTLTGSFEREVLLVPRLPSPQHQAVKFFSTPQA
jgi:hypothetical protein